jgi:Carbohydrate binding module (family 6)
VGLINGSGDARSDSFVDFQVNVPSAGPYTMTIRYANGGTATSTQGLAYDGGAWSTVPYPVTGAWGSFGRTVSTTVTLNAGSNIIRLAKGAPSFAGGSGFAELDSITLTPG